MHTDAVAAGLGTATVDAIRRSVGTRRRQWLVAITVLLAALAAVAIAAADPADRTFAKLSEPVQLLMSVTVPFLGVLLVHDLKRAPRDARVTPTLLAAMLLAAVVGVFGVLVCAATLAAAPSGASVHPWRHAVTIAVGGVLVQVVAQLQGTGLGLVLRSRVIACLATIVLPMGLYLLLGAVDGLHPAQGWLTPYAAARNVLSGRMSALAWAQWLVVVLIWGVGLNTVGIARLKRSKPKRALRA